MTRGHLGFVFMALYLGWIVYRLFVKRDMKQYKSEFYLYTFFIAAWVIIYSLIFYKEIGKILHV